MQQITSVTKLNINRKPQTNETEHVSHQIQWNMPWFVRDSSITPDDRNSLLRSPIIKKSCTYGITRP